MSISSIKRIEEVLAEFRSISYAQYGKGDFILGVDAAITLVHATHQTISEEIEQRFLDNQHDRAKELLDEAGDDLAALREDLTELKEEKS